MQDPQEVVNLSRQENGLIMKMMTFICSKSTIEAVEKVRHMSKLNNKETRTTSLTTFPCVSIAELEHIFVCLVFIAYNKELFDIITKDICSLQLNFLKLPFPQRAPLAAGRTFLNINIILQAISHCNCMFCISRYTHIVTLITVPGC